MEDQLTDDFTTVILPAAFDETLCDSWRKRVFARICPKDFDSKVKAPRGQPRGELGLRMTVRCGGFDHSKVCHLLGEMPRFLRGLPGLPLFRGWQTAVRSVKRFALSRRIRRIGQFGRALSAMSFRHQAPGQRMHFTAR